LWVQQQKFKNGIYNSWKYLQNSTANISFGVLMITTVIPANNYKQTSVIVSHQNW
jgi:hypothetical protein